MAAPHQVSKMWILFTVVFALGFGGLAYLVVAQYQHNETFKSQTNQTIADLRYQLTVAQNARYVTPSPTIAPATPRTLVIKELGVQLTATAPVTDLTYQYQEVAGLATANLVSTNLLKTVTCHPGALGQIIQRPTSDHSAAPGKLIQTIGANNYYYVAPAKACATDPATKSVLTADQTALNTTILATLATAR